MTKRNTSLLFILLLFIAIAIAVNSLSTRNSLNNIKKQISITSDSLQNINKKISNVIYTLKNSTLGIDSILINIEESKELLNDISQETHNLTKKEKLRIKQSIQKLETTKHKIEKEKVDAKKMIDILNKTSLKNE